MATLPVAWTCHGKLKETALGIDSIFVREKGSVTALNARTGDIRWRMPTEDQDQSLLAGRLVVIDESVAAAAGSRLFLFESRTGALRHVFRFAGPVRHLAGPPLVAEVNVRLAGSAIYRVDPEKAKITASRRVGREVYDVIVEDAVVVVKVGRLAPSEQPESHLLIGFRPEDLKEIWRRAAEMPSFERINEKLYIQVIAKHDRGYKIMPLDPWSGRLGTPLPRREPIVTDYGASTWELEILDPPKGVGGRLRRNDTETGLSLWTVDLPAGPMHWVRRNDKLYVQSQDGSSKGVLATVDWNNGRVEQLAQTLPDAGGLLLFENMLIVSASDRIVAFRPKQASASAPPPLSQGAGL
jgi:hypothetical protein